MMSKLVAAGFVIFRRLERNPIEYLLLQTSYGTYHWNPPKGHLDPGETPLQAALRETKEEADLDKSDLEYYDKFEEKISYESNGRPKDVFYYLARLRNGQQKVILSNEHQNFVWLNLQEACRLVSRSEMQNVLQKAEQFIANSPNE